MTMGIIRIGTHLREEDIEEDEHLEVGFSSKVEVIQSSLTYALRRVPPHPWEKGEHNWYKRMIPKVSHHLFPKQDQYWMVRI